MELIQDVEFNNNMCSRVYGFICSHSAVCIYSLPGMQSLSCMCRHNPHSQLVGFAYTAQHTVCMVIDLQVSTRVRCSERGRVGHCSRAVGNLLTSEPQYHESSVVCRGLLKLVSMVCLWPQAVI